MMTLAYCKTVFRWLVRSRRSPRTVLTLRIWRLSTKTWHFWEVSLKHGSQSCGRSFPGTNGTSAGEGEMKRRPRMGIMTFRAGMVASPHFHGNEFFICTINLTLYYVLDRHGVATFNRCRFAVQIHLEIIIKK